MDFTPFDYFGTVMSIKICQKFIELQFRDECIDEL